VYTSKLQMVIKKCTPSLTQAPDSKKTKLKNSVLHDMKTFKFKQERQTNERHVNRNSKQNKGKVHKSKNFKHFQDAETPSNKTLTTSDIDITPNTFINNFKHYVEYLACSTIGDSNTYYKHLQKEQSNKNPEATSQLQAVQYFEILENEITSIEHKIGLIGNERLVTLLKSLRDALRPPETIQNYWCICALTGMPSNQLIALTPNFKIDAQYQASVTALWLCLHLPKIEQTRIDNFISSYTDSVFVSKIINAYLQSEESTSMCQVYFWAFKKCFDTFEHTFKALSAIIDKAKVLTGINEASNEVYNEDCNKHCNKIQN